MNAPARVPTTLGRGEATDADFARRIRLAMSRMRSSSSVDLLIHRAAEELCGCVEADGAALVRVEGDEAVLQALFCAADGDLTARPGKRALFSLQPLPVERAIVRHPRAMIVGGTGVEVAAGGQQPWPGADMTCVAAPVSAGGSVVGLVYAVWAPPSPVPGVAEVERTWAFAAVFGSVLENVWLLERLELQLGHVRPLLMAVGAVLREVSPNAISLAPAGADTLPDAIPREAPERSVEMSGFGLTAREAEVLALLARGATNGRIAAELVVTEATVKSHVGAIFRKLGVANRAEAAAYFAARQTR